MATTTNTERTYRNHRIYGVEGAIRVSNGAAVRQVRCTIRGREIVLVSFKGGKVEIYKVVDGLEMFVGYVNDVAPSHGVHELFQMERNPLRVALQSAWAYEGRKQWADRRCALNAIFYGDAVKPALAAPAAAPSSTTDTAVTAA